MKKIFHLGMFTLIFYAPLSALSLTTFLSKFWQPKKLNTELTQQQLQDLHTGNYYFWLTKFDKAEQYYRKLAASGYPYAHRLLSTVYWGQGNARKSTESLLQQIKIAPTADVYQDLGNIYLQLTEDDKALEYLKKAADLNHVPALRDLTIYYFNKKIYSLAELYGKKAADLGNLEVCALLSTFFWNRKNYQKAESFLAAAAAHDATPYLHLSYIYHDVYADADKAVAALKEGLEKQNILCALELGNYYFSKKEYETAQQYYIQLTSCKLEDPAIQRMIQKPFFTVPATEILKYKNVAHVMLGHVYEEQGLDDQALTNFLASAHNNDPQGQYGAGALYLRHGDTKAGLPYLQLSADQNYEIAQYSLGKYYFEQHEFDQAKSYLEKCTTSSHEAMARYCHSMLGEIYKAEHNTSQAMAHFKYAADAHDTHACYEYALLLEAHNDIDQAAVYYRLAADLGHPSAQDKIRALDYYPAT